MNFDYENRPLGFRERVVSVATRKHVILERIKALEAELTGLERWPVDDPYADDTVLRLVIELDGKMLTYVALRAAGRWYTTGPVRGIHRFSWSQFVEWLSDWCLSCEQIWPVVDASSAIEGDE